MFYSFIGSFYIVCVVFNSFVTISNRNKGKLHSEVSIYCLPLTYFTMFCFTVVTSFFAYFSRIIPSKQREFGIIALSVCAGVQILWEIIFEIKRRRTKRELTPPLFYSFELCSNNISDTLVLYFYNILW